MAEESNALEDGSLEGEYLVLEATTFPRDQSNPSAFLHPTALPDRLGDDATSMTPCGVERSSGVESPDVFSPSTDFQRSQIQAFSAEPTLDYSNVGSLYLVNDVKIHLSAPKNNHLENLYNVNKCRPRPPIQEAKAPHLVAKRNARERKRVEAVNGAFARLRKVLPFAHGRSKRISKVRTLQEAIAYIGLLQETLRGQENNMKTRKCGSKRVQDERCGKETRTRKPRGRRNAPVESRATGPLRESKDCP